MIYLILGGSGSGKSELAEQLSLTLNQGQKLYIATMYPYDEESKKRVEKHKRMRKHKRFVTAECYTTLKKCEPCETDTVLLDCMSNLVANEMFLEQGAKEHTVQEILMGIDVLTRQYQHVVVVSNDIFCDGVEYTEDMVSYLSYLAEINCEIVKRAQIVTEVVCGIPIHHKGGREYERLME